MTSHPADQVYLPPELPPYLKGVQDLKPIVGVPKDEELIRILAVIRAAQKGAEIPGMADYVLISRLSEHLFEVQLGKSRYRNRYLTATFPETTTYTPPTFPAHVSIQLEPVTGAPLDEEVIKVEAAIRSYHQFSNVPSMFDPRLNAQLSQYLFDIQMGKHTQRARQSRANSVSHQMIPTTDVPRSGSATEDSNLIGTNNAGTGSDIINSNHLAQAAQAVSIRDTVGRSNRLAERANQLIERSNQIAERSNELVGQLSLPVEQSNQFVGRFNELFERLDRHSEQSNELAKKLMRPIENIGDVMGNINQVLVRIQHAIVRNHKGNTPSALDCLVNEKGETPAISRTTHHCTFADFSSDDNHLLPVVIDGISQSVHMSNKRLGRFLCFYGIGKGLRESESSDKLKAGWEDEARTRLSDYLSSCLG
ncbi:unnamed protein product [Rhizoctonia solani]|uniref:Laminin domain protein n=1 Tax=Rhizoctonia solani TaxID=456999 RepID=A0A8H2XBM4_9AGAM|nr:unnamed protein product [Rhizoctonia solani]